MLDVFLDMTNTAQGHFGNRRGGRCAVGSALWEIGIPHDRLLPRCILQNLSGKDKLLIEGRIPMLDANEGSIACWYDDMVNCISQPGFMGDATFAAMQLLKSGRQAGINFIIASPLPKVAKREVAYA